MRPLFQNHRQPTGQNEKPPKAHTGLWYDKFCDQWHPDPTSDNWPGLGDEGKLNWINAVEGQCGDPANIHELALRQRQLVQSLSGQAKVFKTLDRFVTGLGRSHPVENGFAWHPTLGTPYLPGSSVKGLVRAYVEQWMEPSDCPSNDTISRIFGPRDNRASGTGSVLFFDALPTGAVRLEADVMTPHYGPYYLGGKGETPPGDWHSPTPIPFLAVSGGQSFQFAVLPRDAGAAEDGETVFRWLTDALQWLGAGAKTAVGYGRFALDEEGEGKLSSALEKQIQEAREKAALQKATEGKSPVFADFLRQAQENQWETKKEAFTQKGVIEDWLDKMEDQPDPDVIAELRKLVAHYFGDELLTNPEKKRGKKKNKPAFKERQVTIAKRINALDSGK
ncbi:MAG: type III-B CRISPR module RAMP protein Cmr6 [Opitutales bacterium]